jgi:hypothetical protein
VDREEEKEMAEKKGAPAKGAGAKKKISKGDSYVCEVCGLAISVDEVCGCVDACDIICCSKPMKQRKARAKAAKK